MATHALFFQPWIGEDYARVQQEQERDQLALASQQELWAYPIHVLGESHYGEQHEYKPDFTQLVVQKCGFNRSRFFANVLMLVSGKHISELDRPEQWQKVAYSNFVQKLLPKARQAPSHDEWNVGRAAFWDQLRVTTPEILVVLGSRLWKELPSESCFDLPPMTVPDSMFPASKPLSSDPVSVKEARAYTYEIGGKKGLTVAVYVKHPSGRGFDWRTAARRVQIARILYSNIVVENEATASQMPELYRN